MILEILGILTAFITIILMLSLFVTTLIQAVDFRGKRKHKSMIKGMGKFGEKLAKDLEGEEYSLDVETFKSRLKGGIVLSENTYISLENVLEAYKVACPEGPDITERIAHLFGQLEDEMRVLYKRSSDYLSIIFAGLIVVFLQVDSIALLHKLSLNEEYRNGLVSQGEKFVKVDKLENSRRTFEDITRDINSQFVQKHSKNTPELEQLSAKGNHTEEDALLELGEVLEPLSNKKKVLFDEYSVLLKSELDKEQQAYDDLLTEQYSVLREYDLRFLPNDPNFDYYASNWLGLLLSVILISLGAPFWFNALKGVVGLKDALAMKYEQK
jgi:hypothetical protein